MGGQDFLLVDAMDDRGLYWSIPVMRIRKVRELRHDGKVWEKIFTEDGEEMICARCGKRTTLSAAVRGVDGWYLAPDDEVPD